VIKKFLDFNSKIYSRLHNLRGMGINMRILVCTDGSEHSQRAVKEAAKIAASLKHVEIYIINVCKRVESSVFDYDKTLLRFENDKITERAKIILHAAEKVFEEINIKPVTILKRGQPGLEIINEVSEGNFDLVILGTRKVGGFKKLLLGSVCNAVVQRVSTNVMIVTH